MAPTDTSTRDAGRTADSSVNAGVTPNFLFLGPAKSGSTWLYNLLSHHPDVFLAAGKGMYYFSSHYDRGAAWYLQAFAGTEKYAVRGELSHNYLPSPEAADRIAAMNPQMKVMACLRNPVDRAFSAYLDGVKNGRYSAQTSFEEAMQLDPTIVDHGRYATHLRRFVRALGRDNVMTSLFDTLASEPQQFADDLFQFLEVAPVELAESMSKKMMPAGRPRSQLLVTMTKRASRVARWLGMNRLRGSVKRSRFIRNALYAPYTDKDRPQMSAATRARLVDLFAPEVQSLNSELKLDLKADWIP